MTRPDLTILERFKNGEIDPARAASKLDRTSQGKLWAGEIALEQAFLDMDDPEKVIDHLTYAVERFSRVEEVAAYFATKTSRAVLARAAIQSALIPVYAWMTLCGQLPPTKSQVTEKAHGDTITIGYQLTKAYSSGKYVSEDEKPYMSGMISEVAILALLQRFAIREVGGNTFSPILSTLREDRRNNSGSTVNHGWDISVFTQLEEANPIFSTKSRSKHQSIVPGDEIQTKKGYPELLLIPTFGSTIVNMM